MKKPLSVVPAICYKLLLMLFVFIIGTTIAKAQCGMTITATATNVTCYNGTNGTINISVTGGVAPYKYQLAEAGAGAWSNVSVFNGLAAAVYPVSVRDNAGCIKTIYATITQPANYIVGYTATDVTCLGGGNGSISVTVSGGTSPYTYSWTKNGSTFANTANISNLLPADYNLIVTDAVGCTTSPAVLQQTKAIELTGFNEDVVANGTNIEPASATTQAYDDGNGSIFYENGYTNASGIAETPGGLPAGGNFNSTQDNARNYKLANYSSNNALALRSATATTYGGAVSGTLSFATQFRSTYSTLYVLASTGSGTGTIGYTVNFADNSTATGQLTFADWYAATNSQSATKAKRVARTTGIYDTRFDFNLFELPITIAGSNQSKIINSVSFSWIDAGNARVNIMGITGYTSTAYGIHINDGTAATVTPSVSIISNVSLNTFCTNQSVTFTATPVNGGSAPTYQWRKNNMNISGATGSTYTTSTLASGDIIKVRMTSNLVCVSGGTVTSNELTMTNGTATAAVTLSATASSICNGNQVLFTATPVNGGTSPSYQWKLNNNNIGNNSPSWSSSNLTNNDQVKVVMTSSIGCAVNNPASSGTITVLVTDNVTPSVTINSLPAYPYVGLPVTFTAIPTNGGLTPLYQWYNNGQPISGAILPVLVVLNPASGDNYSIKLTSSHSCAAQPYAMSNYMPIGSATLPVTLLWYNARPDNGKALLQWQTTMELNNKQFIVERADNNTPNTFTRIAAIAATNQSSGSVYEHKDAPGKAGIYLYKLIQEDQDGSRKSLGIRSVDLSGKRNWAIQDFGNTWQLTNNGKFLYRLLDASGRLIQQSQATNNIHINKPTAHGIYLLQFETNGETFTQKLVK